MSVAQAQREIDSQEFAGWLAFDRVSPFGEERADLRSAIIAATFANAHRGKNTKAFTVADFTPRFDDPKSATQTPDEMFARLAAHAVVHNRKVKG